IIDPRTGKTIAKMEVGESIIPVDTTAENRSLIEMMLANKGKKITPEMLMDPSSLQTFNHSRASEGVRMEKGGFIDRPAIRQIEPVQQSELGNQSLSEVISELRSIKTSIDQLELIVSTEDLAIKMKESDKLKVSNQLK